MDHFHNAEAIIENYCLCTADKFLVWSCKTLRNWKAIYAVPDDAMLYEVTFDGEKQKYYFDAYKKLFNTAVRPDDIEKMTYQRELPLDVPESVEELKRKCFWYEEDEQDLWSFLLELMNRLPLCVHDYHPDKTIKELDKICGYVTESMDEIKKELKRIFAELEKDKDND
ncbi:DUF6275 family protein [Turicimonas muris]|uniref:DUF6275 family protein n=1 Tax=Turicimonas muris TaxID=1796652 RepID=UPI002636BE49|nr:DUF6275 family protein [Turicimonas muris]